MIHKFVTYVEGTAASGGLGFYLWINLGLIKGRGWILDFSDAHLFNKFFFAIHVRDVMPKKRKKLKNSKYLLQGL